MNDDEILELKARLCFLEAGQHVILKILSKHVSIHQNIDEAEFYQSIRKDIDQLGKMTFESMYKPS